jgi:uncharacterized membrane protein YoaK (UPF0700 family)/anti-anti-sigma regulatory factor
VFVAQAHSFTQQARLAITLAWVAGYTNIIAVLTCGHVVSHVSGTTSDLGRGVANGTWNLAGFALYLLATFLVGAAASGLTTELARRRGWESIYVLPMAIEALLLSGFAFGVELIEDGTPARGMWLYVMTGLASAAMGLQNATITRISSGVVRTTHVTGVITDLGIEIALLWYWLWDKRGVRGIRTEPVARRLVLLASIMGSFALGAGLGATLHEHLPRLAMFPPVLFLAWIIYIDVRRPIAEIEPSELLAQPGLGLPRELAVFHLRKDHDRIGKVHRIPNLTAWAERLPAGIRVVILDLEDVKQIDRNSAMELRAALKRLGQQQCRLVIAGLNGEQYEQLKRAGAGEMLDPLSVCPDLELAIAQGIVLLEGMLGEQASAG